MTARRNVKIRRPGYFVRAFSLLILIILVLAEATCRLAGLVPLGKTSPQITVEPGNSFYVPHPVMGYTHIPGEFNVTLPDSYSFKATHLDNTLRITQPLDNYDDNSRYSNGEIWIFGGSFTYGWSINDEETFSWLIQEEFNEYDIVNFGVEGYGTIHSLLQFREFLEKGKSPVLVVLAYAGFHDRRNVLSRRWRKAIYQNDIMNNNWSHPRMRFDSGDELTLNKSTVSYRELPLLRHSSFINLVDDIYNRKIDSRYENMLYRSLEVSRSLIMEFHDLCSENDIGFIVSGIYRDSRTQSMLKFLEANGINTVDISVDHKNLENVNLPHDPHPGALANRRYANKLTTYFREKPLP